MFSRYRWQPVAGMPVEWQPAPVGNGEGTGETRNALQTASTAEGNVHQQQEGNQWHRTAEQTSSSGTARTVTEPTVRRYNVY